MNAARRFRYGALTLCLIGLALATTGCPLSRQLEGTAKVATVLTWGADPGKAGVPNDDIESLLVTITKITMVYGHHFAQQGPNGKAYGHLTVFDADESGPLEVDLKDLTEVAALISTAEVPAGIYNQIRLYIEDPVMVMADEKAEVTNVHLTANSRLFITGAFEIPAGEVVILLDLDGVKIVQRGNGDYTWTPQLHATIDVSLVETISTGTIEAGSLDTGADTFTLVLTAGNVFVDYSGAEIYLDTTLVDELSLAEGQVVEVTGVLVGDVLTASIVRIVP